MRIQLDRKVSSFSFRSLHSACSSGSIAHVYPVDSAFLCFQSRLVAQKASFNFALAARLSAVFEQTSLLYECTEALKRMMELFLWHYSLNLGFKGVCGNLVLRIFLNLIDSGFLF